MATHPSLDQRGQAEMSLSQLLPGGRGGAIILPGAQVSSFQSSCIWALTVILPLGPLTVLSCPQLLGATKNK